MRYFGKILFVKSEETEPYVYSDTKTIKQYHGDAYSVKSRWENNDGINKNIVITPELSILADQYAYENFPFIKAAEYRGFMWEVTGVDASEPPRLKLTLGGLYNE